MSALTFDRPPTQPAPGSRPVGLMDRREGRLWHRCGQSLDRIRINGGAILGYSLPGAAACSAKCPECSEKVLVVDLYPHPLVFRCRNLDCTEYLDLEREETASARDGYCKHCVGRCPSCWAEVGPVTAAIARREKACPECSEDACAPGLLASPLSLDEELERA